MSDRSDKPRRGHPVRHPRDQTRKERLAAALRANLKRRKVGQYGRAGGAAAPEAGPVESREGDSEE